MATKNLKVLMSGDTKPYRQEIDQAAVATKVMSDNIGGQLNDLAGLFDMELGTIGQSAKKISTVFVGLTAAFTGAAAGGSAYAVANAQLTAATNAVSGAEARLIVANQALVATIATGVVTAEAMAAAELEVTAATTALAVAQRGQVVAQTAVTAATGLGIRALKIFRLAMISTGIGALIVALGSLISYFTQTERGAEFIERAMAGVKAAFSVLIDRASSFGEGLFKIFSGDFKGGWDALKSSVKGVGTEMAEESKAAVALKLRYQELEDKERSLIVVNAERRKKISELRLEAKQEDTAATRKRELLLQAMALERVAANSEKAIAKEKSDIFEQQMKLGEIRDDALKTSEELKAAVIETDERGNETLRSYSKELKTVTKEIKANAAAILSKAEAQRVADKKGFDVGMKTKTPTLTAKVKPEDVVQDPKLKAIDDKMFTDGLKNSQKLMDGIWRKTSENIAKTKGEYIDLSSSLQGSLVDMGTGIGEFVGSLIMGEGSIQSFGSMIAGMFAELATTIGKQMIAFGVAGIALQSLAKTPWTAVAAGIALIALGSMATAAVGSSIAGGGASGSMPSGNQNYDYDTRSNASQASAQKIQVEVTGTLNASAKGLSTTLNKENTRVAIST